MVESIIDGMVLATQSDVFDGIDRLQHLPVCVGEEEISITLYLHAY